MAVHAMRAWFFITPGREAAREPFGPAGLSGSNLSHLTRLPPPPAQRSEAGRSRNFARLEKFLFTNHNFSDILCKSRETDGRACDSDVSGQSSCDKAQSPANRGVERAERKNLGSVDYCLTTKFPDAGKLQNFISLGTRPWRRWIARVTPTHKAAGSNPVGRARIRG